MHAPVLVLSPVTSPLRPVIYPLSFRSPRLEDGISITGYDEMAPAISSCPGTGTNNVRLENATSQPSSSDDPRKQRELKATPQFALL